jgi:hypothetical protein
MKSTRSDMRSFNGFQVLHTLDNKTKNLEMFAISGGEAFPGLGKWTENLAGLPKFWRK